MTRKGILALLALGLVTAGVWMISPPVALIVCGAILLAAVLLDATLPGRSNRP